MESTSKFSSQSFLFNEILYIQPQKVWGKRSWIRLSNTISHVNISHDHICIIYRSMEKSCRDDAPSLHIEGIIQARILVSNPWLTWSWERHSSRKESMAWMSLAAERGSHSRSRLLVLATESPLSSTEEQLSQVQKEPWSREFYFGACMYIYYRHLKRKAEST